MRRRSQLHLSPEIPQVAKVLIFATLRFLVDLVGRLFGRRHFRQVFRRLRVVHERRRCLRPLLASSAAGCLRVVARARLSRAVVLRRRRGVARRHLRKHFRLPRPLAASRRSPRSRYDVCIPGTK